MSKMKLFTTFFCFLIMLTFACTCFASDEAEESAYSWLSSYNAGIKHFDKNEFSEAIQLFTESIRENPNLVIAYVHRGFCYGKLKNTTLCDTDITRAIEINAKLTYEVLGRIYLCDNQYKTAISYCTKLIEIDPKNKNAYLIRGQAYIGLKRHNLATADFNTLYTLNPDSNDAGFYLLNGDNYFYSGDYNKAIENYNKALILQPKLFLIYVAIGNLFGQINDYQTAINNFQQAIRLCPDQRLTGVIYFNLAQSYELKGDKEAAIKNYQLSIQNGLHGRNPNSRVKAERRIKGDWNSYPEWI